MFPPLDQVPIATESLRNERKDRAFSFRGYPGVSVDFSGGSCDSQPPDLGLIPERYDRLRSRNEVQSQDRALALLRVFDLEEVGLLRLVPALVYTRDAMRRGASWSSPEDDE